MYGLKFSGLNYVKSLIVLSLFDPHVRTAAIVLQMAGIREFGLGEGVDASGVTTKILTCNCSIHLLIENKSKLFGLHIHPPIMDISFARLPIAISRVSLLAMILSKYWKNINSLMLDYTQ